MKTDFTLYDYRGQRYDENIESDLLREFECLPDSPEDVIGRVIRMQFPETKFTLLLNMIPEQSEDIYHLLIDNWHVAILEVPRQVNINPSDVLVETLTTRQYRKSGGCFAMRFDVAVKLIRELIRESADPKQEQI